MTRYSHYFNDLVEEGKRPPAKTVTNVYYHFLSGLNKARIGGNTSIMEIEYEKGEPLRVMVDPGDMFGDRKKPEHAALSNCDSVIADMRRYFDRIDENGEVQPAEKPLESIILSHSHKDHIGAISKLMLMGYRMPVIHATPYTKQRLYQHLDNENIPPSEWPVVRHVTPGQKLHYEGLKVGFFSVSHSTPQSLGLVFETSEGNIVHTCDWKMDDSLTWGPNFDPAQYKRMTGDNVSLLLMDSTGADSNKKPVTEAEFRKTLTKIFKDNPDKRLVIATHPGFEENMASIAKVTSQMGRKFFIEGWSHGQVFQALRETGLKLSDYIREKIKIRNLSSTVDRREMEEGKPGDSIVLVAGVMGQRNSSLARAAYDQNRLLKLDPKNDIILFCGPNIGGQDRENKYMLLKTLKEKGFTVMGHPEHKLYPHAHARRSEIVKLAEMTKPQAIIPVHGDQNLRDKNEELLKENGHKVIKAENGQTVRLKSGKATIVKEMTQTPNYIGFETRTGSNWRDKDYVAHLTIDFYHADNDNDAPAPDQGARERRKPRIFRNNR